MNIKKIVLGAGLLGLVWIAADVYGPWYSDLKKFDAVASARIETNMWRAYYEKRPMDLFKGLVEMLRTQNGFPLFRAAIGAYWAGKAALIFKDGTGRADYVKALPYLRSYWGALCRTGQQKCDTDKLAQLELEWWIIHRERGMKGETALVNALASTMGELYKVPADKLEPYAHSRARAMLERTSLDGKGLSESNWLEIQTRLHAAYQSLFQVLNS